MRGLSTVNWKEQKAVWYSSRFFPRIRYKKRGRPEKYLFGTDDTSNEIRFRYIQDTSDVRYLCVCMFVNMFKFLSTLYNIYIYNVVISTVVT
jgi:hypothetical protein